MVAPAAGEIVLVPFPFSDLSQAKLRGLHAGECEVIGAKIGGIAVHTGARVAANATPGDILVSNTVKDLVAGSGIGFESRGIHVLKGGPGEWPLFAVTTDLRQAQT